jgi:hypothetical protein
VVSHLVDSWCSAKAMASPIIKKASSSCGLRVHLIDIEYTTLALSYTNTSEIKIAKNVIAVGR